MNQPRIYVDFNEMPSKDEVLLSKTDTKPDSAGNTVTLREGALAGVYMDDTADDGTPDRLIADGVVSRNEHGGWTAPAKWLLKIDQRGVRHESEDV